jgi:hypothetical protein
MFSEGSPKTEATSSEEVFLEKFEAMVSAIEDDHLKKIVNDNRGIIQQVLLEERLQVLNSNPNRNKSL